MATSDIKSNVPIPCRHAREEALSHPAETSKNSDICDFLKVSDIVDGWWSMENLYFKPFLLVQ